MRRTLIDELLRTGRRYWFNEPNGHEIMQNYLHRLIDNASKLTDSYPRGSFDNDINYFCLSTGMQTNSYFDLIKPNGLYLSILDVSPSPFGDLSITANGWRRYYSFTKMNDGTGWSEYEKEYGTSYMGPGTVKSWEFSIEQDFEGNNPQGVWYFSYITCHSMLARYGHVSNFLNYIGLSEINSSKYRDFELLSPAQMSYDQSSNQWRGLGYMKMRNFIGWGYTNREVLFWVHEDFRKAEGAK